MHIPTIGLILNEIDVLERRYRDALKAEPPESLIYPETYIIDGEHWKMTRAQRYAAFVESFSRMRLALQDFVGDVDLFLDKGAKSNVSH